jgi:hypothetical protein
MLGVFAFLASAGLVSATRAARHRFAVAVVDLPDFRAWFVRLADNVERIASKKRKRFLA